MELSDNQRRLYLLHECDTRYVIATGPVRSGKTYAGLNGFMLWAGRHFSHHDFALAARSERQWNAVIKSEVNKLARSLGVEFKRREDHYELPDAHGGFNRFWPALGSDTSSVERIQGWTLAGAYLDEYVLMPKEFVDQMGLRCSETGAKLVMVCNPEGPLSWAKVDYIDRAEEIDATVVWFTLDDNPSVGRGV